MSGFGWVSRGLDEWDGFGWVSGNKSRWGGFEWMKWVSGWGFG